jgi:sec-independent protein translocase protein TatA
MNTQILAIGSLGNMEIVMISVLILVLFGAKKLPTFARSLGRSMGEFKRAKDEFESELRTAATEAEQTPPAQIKAPVVKAVEREADHHEA